MPEQNVALREQLGLRAITDKEEGTSIGRLPAGVYGFTNSPASDELPVFTAYRYHAFEAQKLKDGSIQLLGYVTANEKTELEKGEEPVALNLYPDPTGESTHLVAVPLSRIDRRRAPSRDQGNWMPVDVAPL